MRRPTKPSRKISTPHDPKKELERHCVALIGGQSGLVRADTMLQAKVAYLEAYPATKRGGGEGKSGGGKEGNQDDAFTAFMTKRIGMGRRAIEQDIQIASSIDAEVRSLILHRTLALANRKSVLLVMARIKRPQEQLKIAKAFADKGERGMRKLPAKYSATKPKVTRPTEIIARL